jgi:hypothetical protein
LDADAMRRSSAFNDRRAAALPEILLWPSIYPTCDDHGSQMTDHLSRFRSLHAAFTTAMLAAIKERLASGKLLYTEQDMYLLSEGAWTVRATKRAMPHKIPNIPNEDFPAKEADECAMEFYAQGIRKNYHMSTGDGKPVPNPTFEHARPVIMQEIVFPITHTIKMNNSYDVTAAQVEATLVEYIRAWLGKVDPQPDLAPLFNLDVEILPIRLAEGVTIEKLTTEKKTEFLNALGRLDTGIDVLEFARADCTLVFKSHLVLPQGNQHERDAGAQKTLGALITSLRLLKSENVGTMGLISVPQLSHFIVAKQTGPGDYEARNDWIWGERYILDPDDVIELTKIFGALSRDGFQIWKKLEFPLTRFNRSRQRTRPEDRILDFAICMEGTLLHDENTELAYRLALRAATLLRGKVDTVRTFKVMRCLYEIRSKIVHENKHFSDEAVRKKLPKVDPSADAFLTELDCTVRQVLLILIDRLGNSNTMNNICKELDEQIVTAVSGKVHPNAS